MWAGLIILISLVGLYLKVLFGCHEKKVQVGKDQEKAQSEKDSHSNFLEAL